MSGERSRPFVFGLPLLVVVFWVLLFLVFLSAFLPCIECPVCGPGSRTWASRGEAMECVVCENEQKITMLRWLGWLPTARR